MTTKINIKKANKIVFLKRRAKSVVQPTNITNIFLQLLLQLENPNSELFAGDNKKVFVKLTEIPDEKDKNPNKYSWKDLLAYSNEFNFKEYVEVWSDRDGSMPNGAQIMKDADYVMFFIPEKRDQARFVSVYRIDKSKYRKDKNKSYFDLTELHDFDNLKERVVVLWKGDRSTAQHWYRDEKRGKLAERFVFTIDNGIRKDVKKFESYADVMLSYDELCSVVKDDEWKRKLSAVNCIYSVIDKNTGKQYIGKTANKNGIWGRWKDYAENGFGGDVELEKLVNTDEKYARKFFQWIILETLPLVKEHDKDGQSMISAREQFYKEKFKTIGVGGNNRN